MAVDLTFGLNINGIPCNESNEGYEITLGETSSATRRLHCAWINAVSLANYLKGSTQNVNGNTIIVGRQQHPTINYLYVDNVKIAPIGKAVAEGTWTYAQLDISYKSLPFGGSSTNPATLRVETIETEAKYITIPADVLKADNESVGEPQQKFVALVRYSVTLYRQSTIPLNAILNCLGKVNGGQMTIDLGEGNSATSDVGTVLYLGPSNLSRTITENEVEDWVITHNFLISPVSHNKMLANGQYRDVLHKSDDAPPYETADLSAVGV